MERLGRLRPRFSPRKQASAHVAQTSVATKLAPHRVRERDHQTAPTCVLDDPSRRASSAAWPLAVVIRCRTVGQPELGGLRTVDAFSEHALTSPRPFAPRA
jgi:hypothetical protein